MKLKLGVATALSLTLALGTTSALAKCDAGEIVIKFSHVTNADKHPKGLAASLLEQRVNDEMNGKACMEVFPNTTLYNDDQVLEALLQGNVQLAAHRCQSSSSSQSSSAFSICRSCLKTSTQLMSSRVLRLAKR